MKTKTNSVKLAEPIAQNRKKSFKIFNLVIIYGYNLFSRSCNEKLCFTCFSFLGYGYAQVRRELSDKPAPITFAD